MKPAVGLAALLSLAGFSWYGATQMQEDVSDKLTAQASALLQVHGVKDVTIEFNHLDGLVTGAKDLEQKQEVEEILSTMIPIKRLSFAQNEPKTTSRPSDSDAIDSSPVASHVKSDTAATDTIELFSQALADSDRSFTASDFEPEVNLAFQDSEPSDNQGSFAEARENASQPVAESDSLDVSYDEPSEAIAAIQRSNEKKISEDATESDATATEDFVNDTDHVAAAETEVTVEPEEVAASAIDIAADQKDPEVSQDINDEDRSGDDEAQFATTETTPSESDLFTSNDASYQAQTVESDIVSSTPRDEAYNELPSVPLERETTEPNDVPDVSESIADSGAPEEAAAVKSQETLQTNASDDIPKGDSPSDEQTFLATEEETPSVETPPAEATTDNPTEAANESTRDLASYSEAESSNATPPEEVVSDEPDSDVGLAAELKKLATVRPFLGISMNLEKTTLAEVVAGSSADRAGLKVGDEIVQADMTKVAEFAHLRDVVRSKQVGDILRVWFKRDATLFLVDVRLLAKQSKAP